METPAECRALSDRCGFVGVLGNSIHLPGRCAAFKGFAGADCEKATAFLDQALGSVSVKEKKPEFYRRNIRNTQQKVGS